MSNHLLITRPNHDVATNYLYYWSQDILEAAKRKARPVVDLKSRRATKKEFTSILKKVQPSLVIINGHGSGSTVMGQDDEPLVTTRDNLDIFKGKIVYARSCKSAQKLGPACVAQGAKAYIGYSDDFVFICDQSKLTKPKQDNTAKLFLEPANQIATGLIKGLTAGDAQIKSMKHYRRNIRRLMTSEVSKEESDLLPYLTWDMRHQVCLGDENARG
ncbi:MAG: hypothetical protein ACD_22C00278G0009 [uncultured bacterium]|nr:MAG: hypothetical protein ACD_22C00278G0009 [uncultured bacterium]